MRLIGFQILTFECHNKCVFCGPAKLGSGKFLNINTAKKQILDWYNLGAVDLTISGGEPLHVKFLPDLIYYAKEIGYKKIALYSTAHTQNTNLIKSIKSAGLDIVMVSLFGSNSKSHDGTTRRKGSFIETMNGIPLFIESGLEVSLNTPISRVNYRQLKSILDLILSNFPKIKGWQLSDIHPTDEALTRPNLQISYDELKPYLHGVIMDSIAAGVDVVTQEFPLCVLYPWLQESQELAKAWKESFISAFPYNSFDYYEQRPLESDKKTFLPNCSQCNLRKYCKGLSKAYIKLGKNDNSISPIQGIPIDSMAKNVAEYWESK